MIREILHHLGLISLDEVSTKLLKSTGNIIVVIDNPERIILLSGKEINRIAVLFESY